jgi:uncharacterized protein with von Willebrand factor type A (vWA) domain
MKAISILLFLLMTSLSAKSQGCLTADIMILIDWSGSERGHETQITRAAALFASSLVISETQVRIGVITFSNYPVGVVNLTGNKDSLLNGIAMLSNTDAGGGTDLMPGLDGASKMLINKRKVAKILIIISDGMVDDLNESLWVKEQTMSKIPLAIYAVQVGDKLSVGMDNLIKLTGSKESIEVETSDGLVGALKRLDLCN